MLSSPLGPNLLLTPSRGVPSTDSLTPAAKTAVHHQR